MKKIAIAFVGFAVLGFGQTALAKEYAMSYSAQELTTAAGVKDVHARIVKVARRYCPTYTKIRDLKEVHQCVADVVEDLVTKVDNPQLTSYHAGDDGVRVATTESRQGDRS